MMRISSNVASPPHWAAEELHSENLMPFPILLDPYQFIDSNGVLVDVAAAGAAAGATAVPLGTALTQPIPKGAILDFGGSGAATKVARVRNAAAAGALSIDTDALVTALVDADKAYYSSANRRTIASGSPIGRTAAEQAANDVWGYGAAADDEFYITAFDIPNAFDVAEAVAVKPGFVVKQNYLPGWATMAGTLQDKIKATYICIVGSN